MLQQRRSRTLLLLGQLTQELDVQRRAGPPFVVSIRANAVLVQEFQQSVETTSRQCHVARKELRARDHPRFAEGRQTHRLSRVELGILESGQAECIGPRAAPEARFDRRRPDYRGPLSRVPGASCHESADLRSAVTAVVARAPRCRHPRATAHRRFVRRRMRH